MTIRQIYEVLPEHLRLDRMTSRNLLAFKEMIDDEVERRALDAADQAKPKP
jgi:hypothetical protein